MPETKIIQQKPTIAIESVTGCAGCQLEIYFQENILGILDKVDLVSAPMIKGKNFYDKVDVLFIEGTVVNQEDLERVKTLRDKCTVLVAIGECACHGCMPTIKYSQDKNKIDVIKETYDNPSMLKDKLKNIDPVPIDKIVKVDYYIKGCPMDKKEFENFVKDFLLGKKIQQFNQPLCYYCSLKENDCLLERGEKCLGPIIDGNCSVMCPSNGIGCTGCRGFIEDSNLKTFVERLKENNISEEEIQNNLHKYAALQYEEYLKIQNPEPIKEEKKEVKIEEKKEETPIVKDEKQPFWKRIFSRTKTKEVEKDTAPKSKDKKPKKKEIKKTKEKKQVKKDEKKKKPVKKEKHKQINIFEAIRLKFSNKK